MDFAVTAIPPGTISEAIGSAPDPAVPDHRPVADTIVKATDTTPDIPLPIPPDATLQGNVSRAMTLPPEEAIKAKADAPVSKSERTLKPYGVTMLPERADPGQQDR